VFEPDSRYFALETAVHVTADGREIRYVRRRFLPESGSLRTLASVVVKDGDRVDLITARTLGDPLQYFRVCDANDAVDPAELTAVPGRTLKIPSPF
jgi:hypothetical protein